MAKTRPLCGHDTAFEQAPETRQHFWICSCCELNSHSTRPPCVCLCARAFVCECLFVRMHAIVCVSNCVCVCEYLEEAEL